MIRTFQSDYGISFIQTKLSAQDMCFSWIYWKCRDQSSEKKKKEYIYMRPRKLERVQGRQSNLLESSWLLESDPK